MSMCVAAWVLLVPLACALRCSQAVQEQPQLAHFDEELAGGATTVRDTTRDAFSQPAANLTPASRPTFFVGNSFFNLNWVAAPATVETRDGLGPLFNARSCSTCHFKDGRGRPPEGGEKLHSMVLRIGVPGRGKHGDPLPDPYYGAQIKAMLCPAYHAKAK